MDAFAKWLVSELDKRDLSRSELARLSGLAPGTISNIINGQRGRSNRSLSAIARALKLPDETIFRVAGILPKTNDAGDPEADEIIRQYKELDQRDRDAVIAFIETLNKFRKK